VVVVEVGNLGSLAVEGSRDSLLVVVLEFPLVMRQAVQGRVDTLVVVDSHRVEVGSHMALAGERRLGQRELRCHLLALLVEHLGPGMGKGKGKDRDMGIALGVAVVVLPVAVGIVEDAGVLRLASRLVVDRTFLSACLLYNFKCLISTK
jgi:hypothetical protein